MSRRSSERDEERHEGANGITNEYYAETNVRPTNENATVHNGNTNSVATRSTQVQLPFPHATSLPPVNGNKVITITPNESTNIQNSANSEVNIPQITQINIQGMHPASNNQKWKISALDEEIQQQKTFKPFVVVTESHLDSTVFDAEVQLTNYNILRSDRTNRTHGGVILYSFKDIIIDDSATYSDDYCSAAMIFNKNYNLVIAVIYRPPNADENSFTDCVKNISSFTTKHKDADTFLMGDLNFRFMQWETETMQTDGILLSERRQAQKLLDYMNENLLVQTVNENTRDNKSILDLVIVDNEDLIHSIEVEKNKYSDHDMVNINIIHKDIYMKAQQENEEDREDNALDSLYMLKADWNKIREELQNVHWDDELQDEDIENLYRVFEEKVTEICTKHTPKRQRQRKQKPIPKDRLALIRLKKNINAKINLYKYVKIKNNTMSEEKRENIIKRLTNKKLDVETDIKESLKRQREEKEKEAIKNIKKNPKAFFTYTKKYSKVRTDVGPLKDEMGNIQSEAKKKADILQQQFKKVFSNPKNASTENIKVNSNPENTVEDIDFTVKDVEEAIDSIPTYAAPGPDKFPAVILKECKKELAPALYKIWRKSLDDGKIPEKLKSQTIIPIYKKGSKAIAANYRPVSLTSHIIKLFERVLRKKIVKFIEENELLTNAQFGFRNGRSTVTQLLEHLDNIISILEENGNADVVYLDFAKAFDKVDHKILLHKLNAMGIQGKILKWIEEFITGRCQQVLVEKEKSETEEVISGVPQGTVLGPVLFICYINDLAEAIKYSELLIFADDSKITKNIKCKEDHEELQRDIHAAIIWSLCNNMQLNNDKFQLLQHGRLKDLKTQYTIDDDNNLQSSENVKDLGIYISEDLSRDLHITTAINSSKKFANWILRTFTSRNKDIIIFLFKTFVVPRLEYGCQVWSPFLKKDIIRVESLQKTITSKIEGLDGQNYHERLKSLKLYSMQRRRERYIMITMWKIYQGLIPNQLNIQFYNTHRFGVKARRRISKATNVHIKTVRFHHFTSIGKGKVKI